MNDKQAKRARLAAFALLTLEAEILPSFRGLTPKDIPRLATYLTSKCTGKQRRRAGAMALRRIQKRRLTPAEVKAEVTP